MTLKEGIKKQMGEAKKNSLLALKVDVSPATLYRWMREDSNQLMRLDVIQAIKEVLQLPEDAEIFESEKIEK